MMIRLSESELAKLSQQTREQQESLRQVIQQVNAAVDGRDWKSRAATSFAERWKGDKALLERLQADLEAWSRELKKHSEVAAQVNRPFR